VCSKAPFSFGKEKGPWVQKENPRALDFTKKEKFAELITLVG